MDYHTIEQVKTALGNPELLGTMTPVLAVGLGTVPLEAGYDYMLVGQVPGVCRDVPAFLERYYGKEILTVVLDEQTAHAAISQAYLKGNSVNHDTFPEPDFLLKPEHETKLLNEKSDQIGPVVCDLAADEIVILETSYHSYMENLDRPEEQEEQQIGSEELPFKVRDAGPVVFGEEVSQDAVLLERRNYCYNGSQDRQGILRAEVSSLPHIIHPSEIQITQIHADGSLTFYVYDHLEKVSVGSSARFETPYYFISFGYRYHRVLVLTVHRVSKFKRDELQYTMQAIEWDHEDVERWLSPGNWQRPAGAAQ